jgi:hypothetical protein
LETTFGDAFVFADGVNCQPGRCSVGKLKSGRLGFIELVGNATGLVRLRVATKYAQDGDERYFNGSEEHDDAKFKEAYTHLYMIGELTGAAIDRGTLGKEEAVEATREIVTSIRDQATSCEIASYTGRVGRTFVTVETKDSGWVVMTAEAVQ